MSIIIPRSGYNRITQRSIIFGPPARLGGAGFRHLYTEQGILQTTYFLRHWRAHSQIGKMFRCTISWLQFSIGVSYPVLAQPTAFLPLMESKWVASMHLFLAEQKLTIQLNDTGIPPLQREHDSYIMDHVLNSNHYTPAEVRRLNYCRLYLNVVTVSDLANPDGMTLDSAFLVGRISTRSSLLAKYGVNQERPSKNE